MSLLTYKMAGRRETMSNGAAALAELRAHVTTVARDVEDVSARVDRFVTRMDEKFAGLYTRLDQLGRPNWTSYAAWGSVVIAGFTFFAFMVTQWIGLRINPIEAAQASAIVITKDNLEQIRQDIIRVREEARLSREGLRQDLKELHNSVFPLEVHRQRWELYDTEIKALQDRFVELQTALGNLYNPSDKLKELQNQIDQLRVILENRRPQLSLPQH